MGEHIFSANPNVIYNNVWGTKDKTSIFEINLFQKKLQYVQNLINESSRDIIIISTFCVVTLIIQYILSNIMLTNGNLLIDELAFGGQGDYSSIEKIIRMNHTFNIPGSLTMQKAIIWEGLHDFILLLAKCYQFRVYNVNDFEDDLQKEKKRYRTYKYRSPHQRDFSRKLKYPEQGVMYVRII